MKCYVEVKKKNEEEEENARGEVLGLIGMISNKFVWRRKEKEREKEHNGTRFIKIIKIYHTQEEQQYNGNSCFFDVHNLDWGINYCKNVCRNLLLTKL